jgi:hypothetical protein
MVVRFDRQVDPTGLDLTTTLADVSSIPRDGPPHIFVRQVQTRVISFRLGTNRRGLIRAAAANWRI